MDSTAHFRPFAIGGPDPIRGQPTFGSHYVWGLKALLEPFGMTRVYPDYYSTYTRHLDPNEHQLGKRLTRKTICFSKSMQMHAIVIGQFVNQYEFGLLI